LLSHSPWSPKPFKVNVRAGKSQLTPKYCVAATNPNYNTDWRFAIPHPAQPISNQQSDHI
jgi:hypothetical protein